jgi:capping protein beta
MGGLVHDSRIRCATPEQEHIEGHGLAADYDSDNPNSPTYSLTASSHSRFSMADPIDSALWASTPRAPPAAPANSSSDLLRRLNPKDVKRNVDHIISLNPTLEEDLLESVDIPLTVKKCSKTKRDFLCCDYNRDGDSWRSPWSNEFEPPIEEGVTPSDRIRKMEVKANEAFDVYRELCAIPKEAAWVVLTKTGTLRAAYRASTCGTWTTALPAVCYWKRVCFVLEEVELLC